MSYSLTLYPEVILEMLLILFSVTSKLTIFVFVEQMYVFTPSTFISFFV